jgi:hypothetical protein
MKAKKFRIILLALACLCFMASCGADNDEPSYTEKAPASDSSDNKGQGDALPEDITVTLIGDSVVLGGVAAVKEAALGIDIRARTDRKLSGAGLDLLKQEETDGNLGRIVVLALGTNFVTKDDIDNAMAVIGSERQVVFVNAYRGDSDYITEVNAAITEAAQAYPANFTIADWYGYVTSHPEIKLASDKCHLTKSSAADYAAVIKAGVGEAISKLKGK